MTSPDTAQMDFLTPSAKDIVEAVGVLLGIVIDHRQFLRFVSRGWLDEASEESMRLGISHPLEFGGQAGRIKIAVWFDSHDLRSVPAYALREGGWTLTSIDQVRLSDDELVVRTPLPISAVRRLAVSSQDEADRLVAMMRSFQNIELSTLPVSIDVGLGDPCSPREKTSGPPSFPENCRPPPSWDAMRGAFAMATWAVPAIDPWLDVLCGSLVEDARTEAALNLVNAPWWRFAPWRVVAKSSPQVPALWRVALAVFDEFRGGNNWRPLHVLDALESRYGQLTRGSESSPAIWKQMHAVIANRTVVTDLDWSDDVLALAITLVLLRDDPDRFVTWREDWPGMPPGAWWTGAVLAGWKCGFERLAPSFRPMSQIRKRLDDWIWRLGAGPKSSEADWLEQLPISASWHLVGTNIELRADGVRWAERGQSNRGQWYRLNLEEKEALTAATALAKSACVDCFKQIVSIRDSSLPYEGGGSIEVDSEAKELRIKGVIELALGDSAIVKQRLNTSRFQQWLATSQIPNRLPRPPLAKSRKTLATQGSSEKSSSPLGVLDFSGASMDSDQGKLLTTMDVPFASESADTQPKALSIAIDTRWPEGLSLVEGFLTLDEESRIVNQIDSADWQNWLQRRVQHYGWRYDYKKHRIDFRDRLEPLPVWADDLAKRLLSLGLVNEMPDQVIVNEYVGAQGIGKHIDCLSCFRGPIVTVSLLETWAMVFRRRLESSESKIEILLPRASAAILDGSARMEWQHEIPKRAKDNGRLRNRRLSVTFRKVVDF